VCGFGIAKSHNRSKMAGYISLHLNVRETKGVGTEATRSQLLLYGL
jgi:hypothetical protein